MKFNLLSINKRKKSTNQNHDKKKAKASAAYFHLLQTTSYMPDIAPGDGSTYN